MMNLSNIAIRLASLACLFLCIINTSNGNGVYNVMDYGANADGTTDNTFAFLNAWKAASQTGGSASMLIPKGNFLIGAVIFHGNPLTNTSMKIDVQGNLLAPSNPDRVKTKGWIEFRDINGLTIGGGGTLDGQGAESWKAGIDIGDRPLTLRIVKCNHSRIADLNLINSKGFHMGIERSKFVSVSDLKIIAPGDSPNTDGIHISYTARLNISNVIISTGDDCISIGAGSHKIFISGVVCGPGHGISVGSLGKYENEPNVKGVRVKNCTFTNTQNGVRIKTWPGSDPSVASNIYFVDIIMNNVSHPIVIDQEYCTSDCDGKSPSLVAISNVVFKRITGTTVNPKGVSIFCSKSVPCKNVQLQDIHLKQVTINGISNVIDSLCTNNVVGGLFGQFKTSLCS